MSKSKVVFVERKFWEFVSIERVFRQVESNLSKEKFITKFQKLVYGNSLFGLIKNILFFHTEPADIYHITGHVHYIASRLTKKNTVLTIHDLGFLHIDKGLKRTILKKLYLDFPVNKLDYITTISEATKREIVLNTNCDANKILVIENPLAEEFKLNEKKQFNDSCPRILQIGTAPHKNLHNLIESLVGMKCRLDIVGKLTNEQIHLLDENNIDYENSYGLDDNQIVDKYENADIVAFCSTFEGFGLPIIESQAMKTPVITSNISPLKEVAGENSAILVNPSDTREIRVALEKLISDSSLRNEIVNNGLENIKRFDAKTIALKYEKLYEEILSRN